MSTQEFASAREEFSRPPAEEFAPPPAEHRAREYRQTAPAADRKKRTGNPLKLTTAAVVSAAVILTGTPVKQVQHTVPTLELDPVYCAQIDAFITALDNWDKDTLCALAEDPLTKEMMAEVIVPGLEALGYETANASVQEGEINVYYFYQAHLYYDGQRLYAFSSESRSDVYHIYLTMDCTYEGSQCVSQSLRFTNYLDFREDGHTESQFYFLDRGTVTRWRIQNSDWSYVDVPDSENQQRSALDEARILYSENLSDTTSTAGGERAWLIEGAFDWTWEQITDSRGEEVNAFRCPMENGTISLCSYDGGLGDVLGTITVSDGAVVENDRVWFAPDGYSEATGDPAYLDLCLNVNGETIIYDRADYDSGYFSNLDGQHLAHNGW